MPLVKVKHSGMCGGCLFTAGVPVELSDSVLEALGEDAYEEVSESGEPEKKQVKKAKNKMVEPEDSENK